MALGLSFAATIQPNLVLMPTPMVCRVATQQTGVIGVFSLVGTPAGAVRFTLQGAPADGSILLPQTGSGAGTIATLQFSNLAQRVEPYLLVISATDGTTLVQSSIAVLARPSLQIRQLTSDTRITGSGLSWTVTGNAYDTTLPVLQFAVMTGATVLSDAQFLAPDLSSLPGLTFQLNQSGTALFAPAQPSPLSPNGGIAVAAQSEPIAFQVYEPNSLYDSPANTLTVNVTYTLGATSVGTLSAGLGGSYDPVSNNVFLGLNLDYLNGMARGYNVSWSAGAAIGSWVGGVPGGRATSVTWQPNGSATQSVSFTATITDPAHLASPLVLTAGPFEIAPVGSWVGTTALQVQLPQGQVLAQDQGKTAWIAVALPDLQANESATVTLTVTSLPSASLNDPAPQTFSIAAGGQAKAFFAVPVPASAALDQMWNLSITAVASTSNTVRTGFGQQVLVSNGAAQLVVTPAVSSISAVAGAPITPVPVSVQVWNQLPITVAALQSMSPGALAQFLVPGPSASNSVLTPVVNATLSLAGAPTGLACASWQLSGIPTQSGSFNCTVQASAPGYQTGSSSPLALTVSGAAPFVGVNWQSPAYSFSGGQLALSWSLSGNLTGLSLQASSSDGTADVVQSWASGSIPDTASVPLLSTEAFLLVASNALGSTYSLPIVAQSVQAGAALPISPTTATLDANGNLLLNWVPPAVDNIAYTYWMVWAETGSNALPFQLTSVAGVSGKSLQAVDGPGPGSTYSYTTALGTAAASGLVALQMQAVGPNNLTSPLWDAFQAFPAPQGAYLSQTSIAIGESFTVFLESINQLQNAGNPGDAWWVEVQNLTSGGAANGAPISNGPLPLSLTAVPMALPASMVGSNSVTIFISRTVTNSDGTQLTLIRSFLVTSSLVLSSSVYQSNPLAYPPPPGFSVAGSDGSTPILADYEVIAPALVRDETTHELKLLLATARGPSASSQFGTMAADVFPLQGRPHTLDLIDVQATLNAPVSVAAPLVIATTGMEDTIAGESVVPFQLQAKGGVAPYRWFAKNLPQGLYLSRDGVMTGAPTTVGRFQIMISVQDAQNPAFSTDVVLALQVIKSSLALVGVVDGQGNAVQALPAAHVGTPYSAGLQATKGITPYTWSLLAGSLPPGLVLNPLTGAITGWASTNVTLTGAGLAFNPTFEVTDAVGASASQAFPLTLLPMVLSLGAPDQTLLVQGVDTQVCIPITGGTPAYSLNPPSLPSSDFSATLVNGVIKLLFPKSYNPSSTQYGNPQLALSLTVFDSTGSSVTSTYTFTLAPASTTATWQDAHFPAQVGILGQASPMADGQDSVSFGVGSTGRAGLNSGDSVALSVTSVAHGGVYPVLAVDSPSSLPARVSLNSISALATSGGNQEMLLRAVVSNSSGLVYEQASREYSIGSLVYRSGVALANVNPLPVALYEVFAFDPQCPAPNSSAPSLNFDRVTLGSSSSLPVGVSLDSTTGMLYGAVQAIPTASSVLDYSLGGTPVAVLTVLWNVTGVDLLITPVPAVLNPATGLYTGGIPGAVGTNYPSIQVGQPYQASLTVLSATLEGLTSVSVIHGSLPLGVTATIIPGDSTTHQPPSIVLSGAPLESGVFDPVLQVLDSNPLRMALFKTRIVVNAAMLLSITTTSVPEITAGVAYSTQLRASGGLPPYTWSITPNPPLPGLTLNSATGLLSGTVLSATAVSAVVKVTDSYGVNTVQETLTLISAAPSYPFLDTFVLPTGIVGGTYEASLQAFGGVPPYTWSLSPVPAGLAFNASTGVLSGIPTAAFTGPVTVGFSDAISQTRSGVSVPFTINPLGSLHITGNLVAGSINVAYSAGDSGSGLATGSCGAMTGASPGFAWAMAHSLTLNGTPFLVVVGGFRRPFSSSYTLSARPAQPAGPLYFNPNVLSSGVPLGRWGVMAGTADPTALNHMLAASAAVSPSEIVVVGGVANDVVINGVTPQTGSNLNQATLLAFTAAIDGTGKITPNVNSSAYSVTTGSTTLISGAFALPTDPAITARYGAAATKLATDQLMLCGGITRAASATLGVPGSRTDLTQDSSGNYPAQYAYLLQINRTVPGTGTPTSASWIQLSPMPVPLVFHRALTLADGRVLVLGGMVDLQGESAAWNPAATGQGSTICLIYDPTMDPLYPGSGASNGTQPWSSDSLPPVQLLAPVACLLPNGQVFVGAPATTPYASLSSNEVNGIPLSSNNNVLLYSPGVRNASVGSWTVFPTTPAAPGTNPRTLIPWGASAHAFGTSTLGNPTGLVAVLGGEQNLGGDGQSLQNPITGSWGGNFDPNAIGLQGSLFDAALVGLCDNTGVSAPSGSLAVFSNPAVAISYFSTNAVNIPTRSTTLGAAGGVPPYGNWMVSPALPTGLYLDSATGELYGTPTVPSPLGQVYTFSVTDSHAPTPNTGSAALQLQIVDPAAPVWTTTPGTLPGSPWIEGPSGSPTPISVQLDATVTSNGATSHLSSGLSTLSLSVVSQTYQTAVGGSVFPSWPQAALLTTGVSLSPYGRLAGVPTHPGIYNLTLRCSNSAPNPYGAFDHTDATFTVMVLGNPIIQYMPNLGQPSNWVNCSPVYNPGLSGAQPLNSGVAPITLPPAIIGQRYMVNFGALNVGGDDQWGGSYEWTLTGIPEDTGTSASGGIFYIHFSGVYHWDLNPGGSGYWQHPSIYLDSSSVTPVNGLTSANIAFTLTVTDNSGVKQTANFVIPVSESTISVATPLAPATVNLSYSQVLSLSGGYVSPTGGYAPDPAHTAISGVPSGMSLVYNASTFAWTLSGVPTSAAVGDNPISFTVLDNSTPQQSVQLTTHLPVNWGTFSWVSGPQTQVSGLWPSPAYGFHTPSGGPAVMLPLGIIWDRFPSTGANNPGAHANDMLPWTVQVTGKFRTTNPTLTLGSLGGSYLGANWTATLIQAPTGDGSTVSTAIFKITWTGAVSTTAGAFALPCVLVDGGTADSGNLGGFFRVAGAGNMPETSTSNDLFMTTSGPIALTSYVG